MVIRETNSKLILDNADKVTGWSELSIVKKFGKDSASGWVEQYPDGVTISQEGSQDPNTNLIISNSNALNYGIKNNSNAIVNLPGSGAFTELEKDDLLEDVRTYSNAFVYCCKNVSNALHYGLKNNSNVIVALLPGAFTPEEKDELVQVVRTTSNAFLYCCKNTSNALVFGLKNNSNAIACFPLTLCGCCDACEPVSRSEEPPSTELRTGFETFAYAEGYGGLCGGTPRYAQGATRGERVENTSRRSFSEARWSPDKNFLAVITETEDGQDVRIYAIDTTRDGGDGLRLVTHVCAPYYAQPTSPRWLRCPGVASKGRDDGAHVSSVEWSSNGRYLGIEIERANRAGSGQLEKELFVYTFDKETETLQELPNLEAFLEGRE